MKFLKSAVSTSRTVACCCRNLRARSCFFFFFFAAPVSPLETSITFHLSTFWLATGLATWFHVPVSIDAKIHPPTTPDISHLETLCTALLSLEVPFRSLRCLPFICFPQLCSSSVIWLTAEADSGMEGFGWFQLEKLCILFVYGFEPCHYPVACFTVILWTEKQGWGKRKTQKNLLHIFSANSRLLSNISTRWNETNLSPKSQHTLRCFDHRGGEHWVPWWSRMSDGRFSLFTLELCPAKLNPLGLLLLSALSSPLLSAQLSNRVGGIRVAVVNTDTKLSHRHLLSITINGTVLEN